MLFEVLAEPLAPLACGGRREGFCKKIWRGGAHFGEFRGPKAGKWPFFGRLRLFRLSKPGFSMAL
jgi:hypothetical protein